jgi:N4-gp56 family major capsid protein
MANIATTQTTDVAQTLLSQYVQSYLWQNAILVNTIVDRSSEAVQGVKTIDFGKRTQLSAVTKNANTAMTSTNFTWSVDPLNLDKHEAVYTILEDFAGIESAISQEPAILESSTEALLTLLEGNIYTALAAATAAQRVKFKTQDTLSLADVLNARKILNKANVPLMDRWMSVNPDQEEQVLQLNNFVHADKYGSPNMPLVNGEIGRVYGFRVVVTNNVTTSTVLCYHRSHVAFARQLGLRFENSRKLSEAATEYLMHQKYGLKTLDSGKRCVLINNSGT